MTINKTKNGAALTLVLTGRLDTTTAPALETVIKTELAGVTDLTLDFTALDYVSSAGLRVLLVAQKTMNAQGKMKIVGVNEIVMEIFEVTGFSEVFTVE